MTRQTPFTDGPYMVHAEATLPGGFRSRVASKHTKRGVEYFHVIQDELTDSMSRNASDDFTTHTSAEFGRYRLYRSFSARDFDAYKRHHRAAVELWTALYMSIDTPTVEVAGSQYNYNCAYSTRAHEGA